MDTVHKNIIIIIIIINIIIKVTIITGYRLRCFTVPPRFKNRSLKQLFEQTYWLEEEQRLWRGTVEDWTSVDQQRQSVKQLVDGQSRLMNRKYHGTTSSRQSTHNAS